MKLYEVEAMDMVRDNIGGYIKDKKNDMSYRKCANAITMFCEKEGIDYSISDVAITYYIGNGEREDPIPLAFITAFCKTFDVSADWLLGITKSKTVNMNMKIATKMTGLLDDEINAFKSIFEDPLVAKFHNPISYIIQSPAFSGLFRAYAKYCDNNLSTGIIQETPPKKEDVDLWEHLGMLNGVISYYATNAALSANEWISENRQQKIKERKKATRRK